MAFHREPPVRSLHVILLTDPLDLLREFTLGLKGPIPELAP
jgi:hypothetical protein